MDWFSNLALKHDQGNAETIASNQKARALWRGLRLMLVTSCELYRDRYPQPPHDFTVQDQMPTDDLMIVRKQRVAAAGPAAQEVAAVTVTFNACVITAVYATIVRGATTFVIGRDADGYVTIQLDGQSIPFDRAAEIILHPVLFPDVPG